MAATSAGRLSSPARTPAVCALSRRSPTAATLQGLLRWARRDARPAADLAERSGRDAPPSRPSGPRPTPAPCSTRLPAEGALSWVRRGEGLVGLGRGRAAGGLRPPRAGRGRRLVGGLHRRARRRRRARRPRLRAGRVRQHRLRPGRRDVGLRRPRGRRRPAGRRRLGDHGRRRRPARRPRRRAGEPGRRPRAPAPLRRRRPRPRHLVRRRRHRGASGSTPASWPRSCSPATCSSPPTSRSTRAGCCAGWPTASPTAGPSPSTACSAPPPSCCCGAPAGSCRPGCWPARRRAGRGRRRRPAGAARSSARPRTAPSTRWPSTRWSRRSSRSARR